MHRGHSWVFRAESHETMLAWYGDIKSLTEKTGEERNAFVRKHAYSVSGQSQAPGSIDSDGALEEDEADRVPYSASASSVAEAPKQEAIERPQPGGSFPSDMPVEKDLRAPLSPSSASSDPPDRSVVAATGTIRKTEKEPGSQGATILHEPALQDQNNVAPRKPRADHTAGGGGGGGGKEEHQVDGEVQDLTASVVVPTQSASRSQAGRSGDNPNLGQTVDGLQSSPRAQPTVNIPAGRSGEGEVQQSQGQPLKEKHIGKSGIHSSQNGTAGAGTGPVVFVDRKGPHEEQPHDGPGGQANGKISAQNNLDMNAPPPVPSLSEKQTSSRHQEFDGETSTPTQAGSEVGTPVTVEGDDEKDMSRAGDSPGSLSMNTGEVVARQVTMVAAKVHTRQIVNVPVTQLTGA